MGAVYNYVYVYFLRHCLQVQSLSLNLTQARDGLRQKTDHATSIQREIVSTRQEQANVKQRLNETDVLCNSLSAVVKNLRISLETVKCLI